MGSRIFTYEQVLDTFPAVRDLTRNAVAQVESLWNAVHSREEMERRRQELQQATDSIVQEWADQVSTIGCEVKGLWLVDWDSGDGYYCWRYPEQTVAHFHGYDEGFAGRLPIN